MEISFLYYFVIVFGFWLIFFTLFRLLTRKKYSISDTTYLLAFSVLLGFSFLGLTLGFSVGLSRTPVVGVVIPAILTFLGAFILVLFATKKTQMNMINSILGAITICAFSFFIYIGMYKGLYLKASDENFLRMQEFEEQVMKHYLEIDELYLKEKPDSVYVNEIRSELKNYYKKLKEENTEPEKTEGIGFEDL